MSLWVVENGHPEYQADLVDVVAELRHLLRCDPCGGTGKVLDYGASPEEWLGQPAPTVPCPAPDCVNGTRLPEGVLADLHVDERLAAIRVFLSVLAALEAGK